MNIGLIDVDHWGKLENCFPNLPLMKLSAYHKQHGDNVEWYSPSNQYDKVYKSKVFSFTRDPFPVISNSAEVECGGTGYAITLEGSKEVFDKSKNNNLPFEIEHIYPDYSLYGITDTAYGFLTRGCPRGCDFCHVAPKEGRCSVKVADVSEFWHGQKNIVLNDPNLFACHDWQNLLDQLAQTKARVEFNQGIDVRIMDAPRYQALAKVKVKMCHTAWDRYQDKDFIVPKLKQFRTITGWDRHKVMVFVLTNFDTTFEQDLERVNIIRDIGFMPYIMRYNKASIPKKSLQNALARYCNSSFGFYAKMDFEEYLRTETKLLGNAEQLFLDLKFTS